MDRYDYVVIGGGIAGASFAARVAEQASVLVLEQEIAPGYHATGRSAALLTSLIGDPIIGSITRASRAFLDQAPAGFSALPLLQSRGVLHIASTTSPTIEALFAQSPDLEAISPEDALDRVPVLRPESARHAYFEAGACDIDVDALYRGYIRQAQASGAQFINKAEVQQLEPCSGGWRIRSGAGEFLAAIVVNAAGAWADEVAKLAGAQTCGLRPLRRTAILIDPPDGVDIAAWPAVIEMNEAYYFKPDAGCLLVSPADESPSLPCDAQPEEWDIAVAADRMETATKIVIKRVVRSWAGLRSFAPDRLPVVGFDPDVDRFFWLAGQGGYGVQTSPALSAFAAALALGQPLGDDLLMHGIKDRDAFLPGRTFRVPTLPVPGNQVPAAAVAVNG